MKLVRSCSCAFALAVAASASALLLPTAAFSQQLSASSPCQRAQSAIDTDLYCIELLPAGDLEAFGSATLLPAPSPFGTSVAVDGRQLFDVRFDVSGLPAPSTLGPYTQYVAWVTTPAFSPMERLGVVQNGRVTLGPAGFNKFFILITAEPAGTSEERRGKIVLRGLSASTRMNAHGVTMLPGSDDAEHAHEGWPMPPMEERFPMGPMPGLDNLTPNATPYLPGDGRDAASIPLARERELLEVANGDTIDLTAGLVRKVVNGKQIVVYAYNGMVPGPLLRVQQGAEITVRFRNSIELPTAVHWHGVRLDNAFDGVPHLTQEPVASGESFTYRLRFPDAGIYWYHPHQREDIQQDGGLYGNIAVTPARKDYFNAVDGEDALMLDDLLIGDAGLQPYGQEHATHAIMGRFGNVLLVNGSTRYERTVRKGDVVRFYFTNVANTRTFNVSLANTAMKLVASDVGKFEHEAWVESVAIAPAERYVIEARFAEAGDVLLLNRVQAIDHAFGNFMSEVDTLGVIHVQDGPERATPSFTQLRTNRAVVAEVEPLRKYMDAKPDHSLELDIDADEDRLPFALVQLMRVDVLYFHPVEWAGTMPMMDWLPTSRDVRWVLRDIDTGKENEAIDWTFRKGQLAKIRITNKREAFHAMQHPIHLHGQRFLILKQNGEPNRNLVWKDTVLIPVGQSVELLVDMSNPGKWMLHCHIAEHLEAGMHSVFTVE